MHFDAQCLAFSHSADGFLPMHKTSFMPRPACALLLVLSCALGACTPDYSGPTCAQWRAAPKTSKPFHPQLWHGTLKGLPQARATTWSLWSEAYAFAYEEEGPLGAQSIEIRAHDKEFKPTGPVLHHTTTDPKGRWCVVVSPKIRLNSGFVVHAPNTQGSMRQVATHHFDLSLNAQTEALTQWAAKRPGAEAWGPLHWLNLRTLADTAAGLLGDVPSTSITSQKVLIERARNAMERDPRLKTWPLAHGVDAAQRKTPPTP